MFDLGALNDFDFEKLALSMMERKLNQKLRYFPPGRDSGIDLVDNIEEKNIIVQVKHYEKSSYSAFLTSLRKEIDKVENLNPDQYYIFTSQSLTPQNIQEIYNLFRRYMKNDRNIISREDINDFLKCEANIDILRQHYKLWIVASNVLTDLIIQNVFIDSEVLMYDLEKEFKYFIPTETFEQALTILQEKRKILLYGAPGVGKTSNSKMLMLYFIKMGYRIRYSSNSENIADLKKALTTNKQGKEIIFLDDCLGQHYFNLKNGQSQELLDLIKHVNLYPNKILILNSRVTILNEAQQKLKDLEVYLNREEFSLKLIDMNQVSLIEKAKIFYTFLQRNEVDNNFYNSLRTGKKYRDIVNHKNYNPRIIEFVTLNYRIKNIPFENYYDFIMQNLNQPKDVWQDEFEVKIKKIDRIFMYTLYSLTDTVIEKDVLRKCFDKVINRNEQIDFTINHFDGVLKRLNRSMIRIIDANNIMKIGVLNPSINDYMYEIFKNNETYRQIIKENAIYLNQIEKACELSEFKEFLKQIESTRTLSSYQTLHKVELIEIKWLIILEFNIVREEYRADVPELLDLRYLIGIGKYKETSVRFFKKLLNDEEFVNIGLKFPKNIGIKFLTFLF